MTRPVMGAALTALIVVVGFVAQPWAQSAEAVDLEAIVRIKAEGLERSEVMDTLWYLTDRYGARLTNSPGMHEAAAWAADRLRGWGLDRVYTED